MVFMLYVYKSIVSGTLNLNTFRHQLVEEQKIKERCSIQQ